MTIVIGGLVPHPPLLIPQIGAREIEAVASTNRAMIELAQRFKVAQLDVLLTISPHGPIFSDAINIFQLACLEGSFANYGAAEVILQAELAVELIELLAQRAQKDGFPLQLIGYQEAERYGIELVLDHGVLIPLYFLEKEGVRLPLVPINIGLLGLGELFAFGQSMGDILSTHPLRIGVLASGDLSHRLTPNAPAGFSLRGQEFDKLVMEAIASNSLSELINIDADLVEKAGECGLRPIVILAGLLEGLNFKGEVLSYEGPFGVGYGVAVFGEDVGKKEKMSAVELARQAVKYYLEKGEYLPLTEEILASFPGQGGSFVSIKKKTGELRGCMGTLGPTQASLAEEIIANAVTAATRDPRFPALKEEELYNLTFSVDVLLAPEEIESLDELDHRQYGIIVEKGRRKGVLLPDIAGIDSVEEQLAVACQKAGLDPAEGIIIKKFKVKRYS